MLGATSRVPLARGGARRRPAGASGAGVASSSSSMSVFCLQARRTGRGIIRGLRVHPGIRSRDERESARARFLFGKKTPGGGGEPVQYRVHNGTHTGHTGAHGHTDHTHTQTNLTSIQTQRATTHPHVKHVTARLHATPTAESPKPRPTQQPQARSRPLPAADSDEATPSEPDPASTRSQSASPRLLESGRRNEGARGRCVTNGRRCGQSLRLNTGSMQ